MIHAYRPDEFSLHLSWSPKVNGETPATPGFYLRAMFANEGAATGVVKGTWSNGYGGNGSLVSYSFMRELFRMLHYHDMLENGYTDALGSKLADYAKDQQQANLKAKRARLERLKTEVAELEAELDA